MTQVSTYNGTSGPQPQSPEKGMFQFLQQSTVYRRNEVRVAKLAAKRQHRHSRFATMRRGLPWSSTMPTKQNNAQLPATPKSYNNGEWDLFPSDTIFSTSATLLKSSMSPEPTHAPIFGISLAAALGGAASELVFGHKARQIVLSASLQQQQQQQLFQQGSEMVTTTRITPIFQGGSAAAAVTAFPEQSSRHVPPTKAMTTHSALPMLERRVISLSPILSSAATFSILFGTKSYLAGSDKSNGIMSSALAGMAKATLSAPLLAIRTLQVSQTMHPLLQLQQQYRMSNAVLHLVQNRQQHAALWQGCRHVAIGEMIGAVGYFATYDAVKSWLNGHETNSPTKPTSSWIVAVSGAVAGGVYQATLNHWTTAAVTRPFTTLHPTGRFLAETHLPRQLVPSLLRGMPIHACLFLCYEAALLASKM